MKLESSQTVQFSGSPKVQLGPRSQSEPPFPVPERNIIMTRSKSKLQVLLTHTLLIRTNF